MNYLFSIMCKALMAFPVIFCLFSYNASAQITWVRNGSNPVLDLGAPGSWDAGSVISPVVLYINGEYQMWYGGRNNNGFEIGYATSPDGVAWTRYPGNPVMTKGTLGSWDAGSVAPMSVVFDGNTYHMWYSGESTGFLTTRIGYAASSDGIHWMKADSINPVINIGPLDSWESRYVTGASVIYDGSIFHMWYSGNDYFITPVITGEIGYATSTDGIHWSKYADNPVLTYGVPGEWDENGAELPTVIFDDISQTYQMWYTGQKTGLLYDVGFATSTDGINWTKSSDNPVLENGFAGTWEGLSVIYPKVIFHDNQYKMWYCGINNAANFIFRIGHATSDLTGMEISDENLGVPAGFALEQNYPNPFNPTTSIRFTLPLALQVKLSVFNTLGQHIATLLNERKPAGSYETVFDGSKLSSGIYYYFFEAGEFKDVRKMLLAK
ncbi:MAG: T9SS type A sorting domain-containing protein [Calditrichaeota bacterium]|nr:T9SS type A sorting domain-containing protein [Calditrichota bacterium]